MSGEAANPIRLLLIDDDPTITDVLSDALRLLGGYDVAVAHNGVDGLEQLVELPPACIIVDIRMPHLDGLQFIRALRGDPATVEIPLVVLSAMIQDRDVLVGILSGADAYLLKPPRLDDLLQAVQNALILSSEARATRFAYLAQNDADQA